jgi:hypothetical protein
LAPPDLGAADGDAGPVLAGRRGFRFFLFAIDQFAIDQIGT